MPPRSKKKKTTTLTRRKTYDADSDNNTDELRATLDCIVADKDPSFILDAVQACSTEDWPRLKAIDILGIIKSLIDIEESINLKDSLGAFTACLNLILALEFQDDKTTHNTVVSALNSAQKRCDALWFALELNRDPKYVELLSAFLHCIVQFGANETYSEYLMKLIKSTSIVYLAMHCIFYAPAHHIAERADTSRIHLMFIGPKECLMAIESFLDIAYPEVFSKQLKDTIRTGTINHSSLVECMVFLSYLNAKYPTQVTLPPDLWKDFFPILRCVVDFKSTGHDVKLLSVYYGNVCLERLLDSSTHQLSEMFRQHDLAMLIADIALMVARVWHPGDSNELRRPTLLCSFPKAGRAKALNVFKEPTIFLAKWLIERLKHDSEIRNVLGEALTPVLHGTLQSIRVLDDKKCPGASAVSKIWSELGAQVGIELLVNPPVGCTWIGCHLFVHGTDDKPMARCAGCTFSQYCSEVCQRSD